MKTVNVAFAELSALLESYLHTGMFETIPTKLGTNSFSTSKIPSVMVLPAVKAGREFEEECIKQIPKGIVYRDVVINRSKVEKYELSREFQS